MRSLLAAYLAVLVLGAEAQAQAQADAPEPVRIGVLAPLSGPLANSGAHVVHGITLALAQANRRAGGREISLLVKDTEGRPDVAVRRAREYLAQDVDFIVGTVDSGAAYAVYDEVAHTGVPFIVTGSTADGLTQELARPNVFRTMAAASQTGHVLGYWLDRQGDRRLAILGADQAEGYETTGGVARTFVDRGGEVVAAEFVRPGAPYGAILERIAATKPDALLVALAGEEATRFLEAFAASPYVGAFRMTDTGITTDCEIVQSLDDRESVRGFISATIYRYCLENTENLIFREDFATRFGRMPTLFAEASYVAGQLILETVSTLGGDLSSSQKVLAIMNAFEIAAPRGPFRFDAFNNPVHTIYIMRITDGSRDDLAKVIRRFNDISQFWLWTPSQFMELEDYSDLAAVWVRRDPPAEFASVPVPVPPTPANRVDLRRGPLRPAIAETPPVQPGVP